MGFKTDLQSNNIDLQTILDTINALPEEGGGGEQATPEISVSSGGLITAVAGDKSVTKQLDVQTAKTVTPSTSEQTAVASGKYTTGAVKVAAMPTTTQATPSITINSNGLITASATQSAGYVSAGTKSATKQLTVQAAQTITPTTIDKTIASGRYLTGTQTIKGDSNLVAGNIKSGVSIFGVAGNYEGSGSGSGDGSTDMEDSLMTRSISTYTNSRVTTIGAGVFYYASNLKEVSFPVCTNIGTSAFFQCSSLTSVNFPVCTSIGSSAFYNCKSLTSVSFPACTYISTGAFYSCSSLTSVSFPVCITIGSYAFRYCTSLTTVSFPACTGIGNYAFLYCHNLTSLYLTGSSLCALGNSNAFSSTPIGGYSASAGKYGSIYVPQSLLASYKAATNWTYFSSRFVAYDGDNSEDSGSSSELVTFTYGYNKISYRAEEGMTWEEFINSEYNDGSFIALDGIVGYTTDNGLSGSYVEDENGETSELSDVIIGGAHYKDGVVGWDEEED